MPFGEDTGPTDATAILRSGADLPAAAPAGPPTLLFAVSVGVIITNLFASQTLVGLITPSLGLTAGQAGLVGMLTLAGYAGGLFFLVPLTDRYENRGLILRTLLCAVAAAAASAFAPSAGLFLAAAFILGVASCAIQMLVPIAAAMAEPERRGRVIGDVMSGLMIGMLLSRPTASLLAGLVDWRAFYLLTAALMAGLTLVLARRLPTRRPEAVHRYPALIASLGTLLMAEPVLRRRSFTAALGMAAFSVFWTAVALLLSQPPFDLGQTGIAVFALLGAGGAIAAPLAGRAGDRGWTKPLLVLSHLGIIASLGLGFVGGSGFGLPEDTPALLRLALLAGAALLLDLFVAFDQTLGRRAVNLLNPAARGRINALFVGIFFLGAAAGSALSGVAWATGGWPAVCAVGAACGLVALVTDPLLDLHR